MMLHKTLVLIFFIRFLIACEEGSPPVMTEPPPSSGTKVSLPVALAPQQTEVWCWAAVIEMVSAYYGNRTAQCQTLSYWWSVDCCTFPGQCVTPGSNYQIQESFRVLGMSSSYNYGPLTWNQVVTEIDERRPFIVFYQGSFSGHVVVVYGYDSSSRTLLIHDPYFGSFEVPYGQTLTYNGSMYWSNTLFRIQRFL